MRVGRFGDLGGLGDHGGPWGTQILGIVVVVNVYSLRTGKIHTFIAG